MDKVKENNFSSIIGSSDQAIKLTRMISLCAGSDASILVQAETGCGKEVVTRELHRLSERRENNFVGINCAAIPSQLLESELFGHKKGAFSGAISDRKGRFQIAHNGTLFLDEVGDMPLDLQAKLLRALEERSIVPLGTSESIPVDVRIIAATHQDLLGMVDRREFREDLYHRLNVIPITIPPLRERRPDIPEFCLHFAALYSDKRKISFTAPSLELLSNYDWPGNVREVANLVKRLGVLSPTEIVDLYETPADFLPAGLVELRTSIWESLNHDNEKESKGVPGSEQVALIEKVKQPEALEETPANEVERIIRLSQTMASIPDEGVAAKSLLQNIESNLIRVALDQSEGNVSKAAKLLNLGRTTLIQKISKK